MVRYALAASNTKTRKARSRRLEIDTITAMHYSSCDAAGFAAHVLMQLVSASDSSILVVFGDAISPEIQSTLLGLFHAIQDRRDSRIRNLHPAYISLLVDFDPLVMTHEDVTTMVESVFAEGLAKSAESGRCVEIPVCYEAEFGPDLPDVAVHTKLSMDEVVRLHASATYDVCFLGFTGGFAYLSGMPGALNTPRLATPRRAVAAGSVGIAGSQTGIYPTQTPGGWRLIGRTPWRMFNPRASQPTLVLPGDRVRFAPIDQSEFERLWQERA